MDQIETPLLTMSSDEDDNPVKDKWYGVADDDNFPTKKDLAKLGDQKAKDLLADKFAVMKLVEEKMQEKDSDSD